MPLIIQFLFLPSFVSDAIIAPDTEDSDSEIVHVEILNEQTIPFEFSIDYKEIRHQIHIRSEKTMHTLRILDGDKKQTRFDVRGSGMIMLPLTDFQEGSYIAEFKFQQDPIVILAKIDIPRKVKPSDL